MKLTAMQKLAAKIVDNLVDLGSADEESRTQYEEWTLTALEKAFKAKDKQIAELRNALEAEEKQVAEAVHNHRVHAARLIDERGILKTRIAELEARTEQ